MEFHFLGTGAGIPSIERNVSACAVRFLQNGQQWLFDCGEATQQQILRSSISLVKIDRIFISHLHGDHIYGLPGVLGSRSFQGGESPLTIYGPKGLKAFIQAALEVSNTHIRYPLEIIEIEAGFYFETDTHRVDVEELDHVMPSFAFRVAERDRPGTLNVEALMKRGIMPGPLYSRLKKGEKVELENGDILNGHDFIGPPKKGRSFVYAGDTRPVEKLVTFAKGVDVLIHEATFREDRREHAHQFGHSTIKDATELAQRAGVHALILTHISSRYAGLKEELKEEAKQGFMNSYLAEDFYIHHLP